MNATVYIMSTKKTLVTSGILLLLVVFAGYDLISPLKTTNTKMHSHLIAGDGTSEDIIASAKATNQRLLDEALNHKIMKVHQDKVPSLSGLELQANILTDSDGNLRVDASIKELFEFYLSSIGEEPLEQILHRIQSELGSQLQSPALEQALSLLKRYVDYKIELASITQETPHLLSDSNSDIDNIKHQKSQLSALRARYFDPTEYQQFFEQEERYDDFMIRHLEIVQDQTLDEETKMQNIEALEQSLPEEVRYVRQKVSLHGNVYEHAEKLKSEGASNEEIFQIREQSLGTEAAKALAKLDKDREHWQQRLSHYAQKRDAIIDSGLSRQDQLVAINDLIETNFSGTERVRVKALDSSL